MLALINGPSYEIPANWGFFPARPGIVADQVMDILQDLFLRARSIYHNEIIHNIPQLEVLLAAFLQQREAGFSFSGVEHLRGGIQADNQIRAGVKPLQDITMQMVSRGQQLVLMQDMVEIVIKQEMAVEDHNEAAPAIRSDHSLAEPLLCQGI
jgi:hypothetical protein